MTEDTVQPALERPRFRNDLVAQPLEEEGVRYVDVTDPNSGSTFRFYDVEYSIACAMDGQRDLDNLAEWTRVELGIEASGEELQSVINTLADLGYLENVDGRPAGEAISDEQGAVTAADAVPQALDNVPTEVVDEPPPGAQADAAAEQAGSAGYTDETAREVSDAYDQVMEITAGEPSVPLEEEPAESAEHEAVPHPVGPIMDESGVGDARDELSDTHVDDEVAASQTAPAAPPPPPEGAMAPAKSGEAEMSFAGLLEDEERGAAAEVKPIPRSAGKSPPPQGLDDEDPTQVPTAGVEDDDDDVSVDLSAHLALDKREVQEAVRSSRVHVVPELPSDVSLDDEDAAATPRVHQSSQPVASASSPPADAPAGRSGPPPIPPPTPPQAPLEALDARAADRQTTKPPEEVRVPPAVALPSRPGPAISGDKTASASASQSQSGLRPRPARPIEPTRMPPPAKAPPKSSSSVGLIIVLLLAAAAFAAAYAFRDRIFGSDDYSGRSGTPAAAPSGAHAATPPPSTPSTAPAAQNPEPATPPAPEASKDALPTATVRAEKGAAGGKIAATASTAGQIEWTVANGAKVEAGAPLVKLVGYKKIEAKLAEGVDRGKFYQAKLDDAKSKAAEAAVVEAFQKKVDEKKQMADTAAKELEKYVVSAPVAGEVKLVAQKAAAVKAGDVVAEVSGGAAAAPSEVLRATFDAGASAGKYKDGGNAVVAAKGDKDKQYAAVVEKVDGEKVTVRLVAAGGATAAGGDEIVLLPPSEK